MSSRISRLVAGVVPLALTTGFLAACPAPAANAQTIASETDRQVNFIIQRQIMPPTVKGTIVDCSAAAYAANKACGAINALDPGWVMPYYSNLALIGLLRAPAQYQSAQTRLVVKNYLRWFINTSAERKSVAPKALAYSITDYNCDGSPGMCTPTGLYADSVDSYTATFLSLLLAAYQTGDAGLRQLIQASVASGVITGIADTVILMWKQDGTGGVRTSSGLTEALPNVEGYQQTMDNAEVYAGLRDFSRLLALLGNGKASYYQGLAEQTRTAMLTWLWDGKNHAWRVERSDDDVPKLVKGALAPAGTAQFWPALFGVFINPATGKTDALADENLTAWRHFEAAYTWYTSPYDEPFGWPNQSMAAAAKLFANALPGSGEGATYGNHWSTYQLNIDDRINTNPNSACYWKAKVPAKYANECDADTGYWSVDQAGWWLIAQSSNPSMIPN
jgi:hypothetical protein